MLTYDDLVNDLAQGCKPRDEWRIGIEHEQFAFNRRSGAPLPYDGKPGIQQILEGLRTRGHWDTVVKNGSLIALQRGMQTVTLEPGGQVEFSGSPLSTTSAVRNEAEAFYAELDHVADDLDIGILAAGFHPEWRREQIDRMPKERYKIMLPYMEKVGKHGVDMMLRTCGVQVNLDFGSEADMVKKYRVALGLQPVMTALLANSARAEGKDTGYKSYRSFIWTDTDPARCGVPPFIFEDGMGFARYVDYALGVPMYFIMRDGHHVDMTGQSFRAFMQSGKATLDDWDDHLTTLFPEVRLKHYLELRGMDSVAPPLVYAMTAFWVGLLYDTDALDQAWDLIRDWPAESHIRLRNEVPKEGLEARIQGGHHLRNMAVEAIEIAAGGLSRLPHEHHSAGELQLLLQKAAA